MLSINKEDKDRAVAAIINDIIVPKSIPFAKNASAIGRVPNISAYIGILTIVASNTAKGLFSPITFFYDCLGNPVMNGLACTYSD